MRQRSEGYRQQHTVGWERGTCRPGPGDKRQTATAMLQGSLECRSQIRLWPILCLRQQSPAVRRSQEWVHIWTAKPGELCVDYLALAQEFLRARSRGTQRRELASHLVFNLERIAFPSRQKCQSDPPWVLAAPQSSHSHQRDGGQSGVLCCYAPVRTTSGCAHVCECVDTDTFPLSALWGTHQTQVPRGRGWKDSWRGSQASPLP